MWFTIAIISVLVLAVGALSAAILIGTRQESDNEARSYLEKARNLTCSPRLTDRRRAGACADRIVFLHRRRGLKLTGIGTDMDELERIKSRAVRQLTPSMRDSRRRATPTLGITSSESTANDPMRGLMMPVGETVFDPPRAPSCGRPTALFGRESRDVGWSIRDDDQIARELAGATDAEINRCVVVGLATAQRGTH